jgi:hypothetical protein
MESDNDRDNDGAGSTICKKKWAMRSYGYTSSP